MRIYERCYYNLLNSAFWGWLSIKSQPQNPKFRDNPFKLFKFSVHTVNCLLKRFKDNPFKLSKFSVYTVNCLLKRFRDNPFKLSKFSV